MKRFALNLGLKSVIILIAVGVLLPVMLSTAAGIVALVMAKDTGTIITGVLVISFTVAAMGSGLIAVVLTSRKARLARRQADFVASVSHEFRTPLSAIRLYAQTLQSGKLADDPEQTAACLATILRETEWLDVMIERALAWRASSRDMLVFDTETQPVGGAGNAAIERFRTMVEPTETDISAKVDTSLPVKHDARALQGIVLNLLTNAYKYTDGEKRIAVRVRDEADHVLIEVEDNGIGLSAVQAKRVFQPFYRANGSETEGAGGVGLGLAIAKHLVARHGGSISVSSRPGEGSIFTIQLPAETGDA